MDFDKVFTEKEAESLLRKSMLEYDFGHFSFKPRLIFKSNWAMHPVNLNYDTEFQLLKVYGDNVLKSICEVDFNTTLPEGLLSDVGNDSNTSLSLNHRSNYYVDLKDMSKTCNFGFTTAHKAYDLKSSKLYSAIVTLMLALTHYDSIVPHLKWLTSDDKDKDYKTVVDQTILAYEVSSGKPITASMFCESDYSTFPMVLSEADSETVNKILRDRSESESELLFTNWFKEYLIFGTEIVCRIETIKDESLRTLLYDLFTSPQNSIHKLLYSEDPYGVVRPSVDIKHIVCEKDMEKRYNLIRDFANLKATEISKAVTDYLKKGDCINKNFGEFIKFCQNESILNIRKKSIIILYNELKKRKLLKKLHDPSTYGMPLPGFAGVGAFDDDGVSEALDETTSMMNESFAEYGDGDLECKSETDAKHKGTETGIAFEELDKLSSNFEANMYKFEVTTKKDTSETARDSYLKIANDMSLLNSNLIRSIKEIKVYNTGGKNPGKSTGKLDKKNLYKYKTSKDIFFDNTYKIKESDLAFGIILDVSGSMSGSGIKYGKATMIVLHETLKALNINHSIITHTSRRKHNCIIDKYQEFKEDKNFSCNKNYALANITARSGNCDSASLYYMEQCMRRVKNKDKICIIFSDGEPTECTDTELIEQVKHMERNGIRVIGVGINYPKIKEYYRNNANGSNLKEMFNIVSDILKQYVLEKIDKE